MSTTLDALRSRYDRLSIPTIHLAFGLSLLLHALAMTGWLPKIRLLPHEDIEIQKPGTTLAVRLTPTGAPPAPPPPPAIRPQPAPTPRVPPPKAAPPPAQKVLTVERPSAPAAPPAAPRPAETARAPASEDFSAMIEARRRAREPAAAAPPSPPAPPAETEKERHNRIAAANLGLNETPSLGADKNQGGGIFQIQRIGFDSAEFVFFGWNKFMKRNTQQIVEVRLGDSPTIELAVARKMIAIIREHESGDFIWQSRRLGREVSLSARMSDNAGLEDFMMREFFNEARRRRN